MLHSVRTSRRTSYWTLGAILLCHLALNAALHLRKVALHASGQVLGDAYGPGGEPGTAPGFGALVTHGECGQLLCVVRDWLHVRGMRPGRMQAARSTPRGRCCYTWQPLFCCKGSCG